MWLFLTAELSWFESIFAGFAAGKTNISLDALISCLMIRLEVGQLSPSITVDTVIKTFFFCSRFPNHFFFFWSSYCYYCYYCLLGLCPVSDLHIMLPITNDPKNLFF